MRALIALRARNAPRNMWLNAMRWALDVECTLACRLSDDNPISGYERTGIANVISDLHSFYAPGRFALDKGGSPTSGKNVLARDFGSGGTSTSS